MNAPAWLGLAILILAALWLLFALVEAALIAYDNRLAAEWGHLELTAKAMPCPTCDVLGSVCPSCGGAA